MVRGRRRRRAHRRDKTGQDEEKSFGSGLDEIGFQPLGRSIVVKTERDGDFPLRHPAPSDAYYDYSSGRIVVEFENGAAFMVPARSLEGLVHASENDIAGVEVLGDTGLHWETLDRDHEIALLMSGVLGTPSFMAEIATRSVEQHEDVHAGEFSAWARPVDEFLSYNIPYDDLLGWEHYHMTAYEVGCEAMVALGQAQRTVGGAKPRRLPERPSTPPRWDDISTVVIYVAAQNEQLRFWSFDTPVRSWKASEGRSVANIVAANGAGPAYTTSEVYSVLEALGLVRAGRWTEVAETVLWRDNPTEWNLDFTSDARFIRAASDAAANVPDDIRSQIDAIVESANVEMRLEQTPHVENADAETVPPGTPSASREMLEDSLRHRLDVLFFSPVASQRLAVRYRGAVRSRDSLR
ncbi:DUF2442 domain-containing protein [Rhizobium sp. M1]|uniref:DUF2442 domain-containing protein n=1 Tax=Rhizobium sp. M1 TaxID=2035453 RepID=UPI000BE9472B|nr:DUF2442 domain-containing protein [Rhizobium sp. M1]PDT10001.1 hypothetical protein CO655_15505 [Rhizobium sp. M1]